MLPSARGAIAYKKAEKEILDVVSFLPPTSVFFFFSPPFACPNSGSLPGSLAVVFSRWCSRVLMLQRRFPGGSVEPVFSPQPERVAIVTGGTDGIGYSTARQLAKLGMHVVIAGNNDSKAQEVVRRIKEDTLNDQVEFLYCDLASMRSIREFVQTFKMKKLPLHVLVNNAGVMMVPQRTTDDGFEEHFGVNYLGHFLLTNLLLDTLQESGAPGRSARVVTVSSATHYVGELNLDDLQSRPQTREPGPPFMPQSPQPWKASVAAISTTRERPGLWRPRTTRSFSGSSGPEAAS
ncbi:dehydrogenase/reductase SDR family member on chromosome X isoform X3 [Oryx dammah]|uniref:dehydrogenase/reductase SDR family member on chromosome X isoform X3 n=1 Tax=Oryx dammah TaxID=59534 RepID=UPI001A9A7C06|nr:dehydrogenase/reductase SDR family member on chromosome X isoform X3 [Oryx dammah]